LCLLYSVRDAKTSLPDAWGLPGSEDRGGKLQSHTAETTVKQPLPPPPVSWSGVVPTTW
jgi:hypothetical protein